MFRLLFAIVGIIGFCAVVPIFSVLSDLSFFGCEAAWIALLIVIIGIRESIIQKKRQKKINSLKNNESSSKAKGELRIERIGDSDYLVWYEDILELPQDKKHEKKAK
jgi:hypothetical protein